MDESTTLILESVQALSDNYVWCFHRAGERQTWVVDPGQAQPVIDYLQSNHLSLAGILLTHHHPDHIGGVSALVKSAWHGDGIEGDNSECPIYGSSNAASAGRISCINRPLEEDSSFVAAGMTFRTMHVPGHTRDHIVFYSEDGAHVQGSDVIAAREDLAGLDSVTGRRPLLFSGDTLFSAGCGRLFEGTPDQMLDSLDALAALPASTLVCCGHEYTLANLAFTQKIWRDNDLLPAYVDHCQALRNGHQPTLPSSIGIEQQINPFMNPESTTFASADDGSEQSRIEAFTALRKAKDAA